MSELPLDDSYKPAIGGYDPAGHRVVALEAVSVTTDTSNNMVYGVLQSNTTIQATTGTPLAADQSNTELRTSLYGKNSVAGDTAIKVNSAGDQYVLGDFTEQASLTAGSLNADLVASTDVSAYKWFSLHINTNAYSGTLTFQGSNDNTNWTSVYVNNGNGNQSPTTTTNTTNAIFTGPVQFRYLRIRMTSYSSGTAQGTLELYTSSAAVTPFPTVNINFPGNGGSSTAIASAALTTNTNSSDQNNNIQRGVNIYINTGSFGAGFSNILITVQGKDSVSGQYFTILQSAALTASTFSVLTVYPGVTATANVSASATLPQTWRVQATASAWGTGGSTVGVSYGLQL